VKFACLLVVVVQSISPGLVDTEMYQQALEHLPAVSNAAAIKVNVQ